ncbi:MAG: twin-arginine translocation signal domain-containing protein, partial [Caldilineaceae bacterium]|nr:twin-arginine translocation signal domain-containing protein [Caldilineaceae bacterium]
MTKASANLSRRDFVRYSGMAAGAAAVAACAAPAAPAAGEASDAPSEDMEVIVEAWAHWEQGLGWIQNS